MRSMAANLYVLVLSFWIGGMFMFSFVITPIIFRSYPRDTAGEIVGRLFPSYFIFTLLATVLTLLLFLLCFEGRGFTGYKICLALLSLAVAVALYMNIHLYPEIKKVKQEVQSFETTSLEHPARSRFRSLHARSAVLNLIMMVDGIVLLIISTGLKK